MRRLIGNPVIRLFAFVTLVLMLTMGVAGFYAFGVSQRYLLPELKLKALSVGNVVAEKVAVAEKYGIPFDSFVGMDDYLASILHSQADIAYLAITDARGAPVYRAGLDGDRLFAALGHAAAAGSPSADDNEDRGWAFWLSRTSLELTGPSSQRLETAGGYYDTAIPLNGEGQRTGVLHVGVSVGFYQNQIAEQVVDIGIALVVALLIAFEILLATTTINLTGPLEALIDSLRLSADGSLSRPSRGSAHEIDQLAVRVGATVEAVQAALARTRSRLVELRARRPERDAQAALRAIENDLAAVIGSDENREGHADLAATFFVARICAFLFVLAEEIARPFLPVFIQRVAAEDGYAGGDMLISLPMSLFLLMVAVSMPVTSIWSERFGRRRTFVLGALLSTIGLVATALGPSYALLLVWRALSGIGYAMTFVACQGYVLDHSDSKQRARGIAVFVGGITAADICGPAVGGMLASRIGFAAVIGVGGGLAALAAVIGILALKNRPRRPAAGEGGGRA